MQTFVDIIHIMNDFSHKANNALALSSNGKAIAIAVKKPYAQLFFQIRNGDA